MGAAKLGDLVGRRPTFPVLLALFLFCLTSFSHAQEPQAAASEPTSYEVLADLLEDDQARARLIEQLRAMTPEDSEESEAAPQNQSAAEGLLSQRLADGLKAFSVQLSGDLATAAAVAAALMRGDSPLKDPAGRWEPALEVLAATIGAVLLAYLVLRLAAGIGFKRLNEWVRRPPQRARPEARWRKSKGLGQLTLSRKLLGILAALALDLGVVFLATLVGYVVATAAAKHPDELGFALQFVVAFLLIEAFKAALRAAFATRYGGLRLLPLRSATARFWNRWLALLIGLTGYTLLVIVPTMQAIQPAVGRLLGLLIMLGVYVYALSVVWTRHRSVQAGLLEWAEKTTTAVFGTLIRVLARTWHLLASAYFTVLLVVSQADQQQALAFMLRATLQTVLAVIVGALLAAALSSLLARRLTLPKEWSSRLPLLEDRVNQYLPPALKGLRLLILLLVALVVMDAWRFFDLPAWLSSPSGQAAMAMVFHIALILAIAALSWAVVTSLIEHRLSGPGGDRPATEREKTLLMLFRSAAAMAIVSMTVLVVLSQIGVDIGPLIAGAGVVGLAIGFGAQKLVQDVITGVFIQLENGMYQNDIVELGELRGRVEKITIRSVVIRSLDGGYHLVPFSAIDKLTNHTRDFGYHYGEYTVAYAADVDEAITQLELAFKDLMEQPELAAEVLEEISIPGVTALNQQGFRVRVLIKTTPGSQWNVQRAYNRLVKKRFDAAGIELPYPQTVLHLGEDRRFRPSRDKALADLLRPSEQLDSEPPQGADPAS